MDEKVIQEITQNLNDLELACLVCLIADQHCIVRASADTLDDVSIGLESICSTAFGFSCASLDCSPSTSLEEFCDAVVDDSNDADIENEDISRGSLSGVQFQNTTSTTLRPTNVLDSRKITNVVIAKHLDQTKRSVQIQALELMRSRRIYSRTAVHAAPRRFLLICLISLSAPGPPFLTPYLNDFFFISHSHIQEVGNVDSPATETASLSSFSSVVRKPAVSPRPLVIAHDRPVINDAIQNQMITQLQKACATVRVTPEVRRYIHNIPTFLRLHRAVAGGVSAVSTRYLYLLTRTLATLHCQSYITPSLVPLAAEKVYAHRVELVKDAAGERSLLWGSNENAVVNYLNQVHNNLGVEGIIQDILDSVAVPL